MRFLTGLRQFADAMLARAGQWYADEAALALDDPMLPPDPEIVAVFEDDALTTQLVCGDITGAQYRAAIERLAASYTARTSS